VRELILKLEGSQGVLHKNMKAWIVLYERVLYEQHQAVVKFSNTL